MKNQEKNSTGAIIAGSLLSSSGPIRNTCDDSSDYSSTESWCSDGTTYVPFCVHCLLSWHHQKIPGLILFASFFQVLVHIDEISSQHAEPPLLQAEQFQLLISLYGSLYFKPLTILVALHWNSKYMHVSFVLSCPELSIPAAASPVLSRGTESPFWTCWWYFPAARVCCLLIFILVFSRTPRSFSAELLSIWVAPSKSQCLEFFLLSCRTLVELYEVFVYPLLYPIKLQKRPCDLSCLLSAAYNL